MEPPLQDPPIDNEETKETETNIPNQVIRVITPDTQIEFLDSMEAD